MEFIVRSRSYKVEMLRLSNLRLIDCNNRCISFIKEDTRLEIYSSRRRILKSIEDLPPAIYMQLMSGAKPEIIDTINKEPLSPVRRCQIKFSAGPRGADYWASTEEWKFFLKYTLSGIEATVLSSVFEIQGTAEEMLFLYELMVTKLLVLKPGENTAISL